MKEFGITLEEHTAELDARGIVVSGTNGHREYPCPCCPGAVTAVRGVAGDGIVLACSRCDLEDLVRKLGDPPTPTETVLAFKPLRSRRASVDMVQPIRSLWTGRVLTGYLNLLVGDEGVGKGTFLAWMIARITRGELPGDYRGKPASVLVVGDEDGFGNVWVPRLVAAGADLELVHDLPIDEDAGPLDLNRDAPALRHLLHTEQIKAVVLDQLLDQLGVGVDNWRDKQVREALAPLRRIVADLDVSVIAALHTNKVRSGSFREKVSGTQAFNALSRSSLYIGEHPDDADKRIVARGKGNYTKRPPTLEFSIDTKVLQLNGHRIETSTVADVAESTVTIDRALGHGEAVTKADLGRQLLADALDDGQPHKASEIIDELTDAGLAKTEIHRLAREMGVRKMKSEGARPHAIWQLPEALARVGTEVHTTHTSHTSESRGARHARGTHVSEDTPEDELERQQALVEAGA